ncbi:MAG: hypothetical protein U0794_08800 [Isosphaeraceae bacterium]
MFAGCLSYLAVLSTLAASITVLNARRPGGGAWAILMGLLVLVFLIPWLEGAGLRRGWGGLERLRLDSPWNIFFGLVVIAGVTNYLPTRYGPAAVWIGFGCGLEYLALSGWIVDPSQRARIWSVAPWCLGMAAVVADSIGAKPPASTSVESLWLWFRDRWGVVWALRVQDRFNRTAELQGWPFRLGWEGLTRESPQTDVDEKALDGALDTLCGLLRRFASVGCLERAARPGDEGRGCG